MNNELDKDALCPMPVLALRGLVMFPNMVMHFDVGRKKSVAALNKAMQENQRIFLVAQRDIRDDDPSFEQLYKVGVVAEIRQILKMPSDTLKVVVEGLYRAKVRQKGELEPYLTAQVVQYPCRKSRTDDQVYVDALMRAIKALFEEYMMLSPRMPKDVVMSIMSCENPANLVEHIAGNIVLKYQDKQQILEESNIIRRLEMLSVILENENSVLSVEQEINEKVKEQLDRNQREYVLREQIRIINSELNDSDNPAVEAETYHEKIRKLHLKEEVEKKLLEEVNHLSKLPNNSHEAGVIRGYLDTCLDLPWNTSTKDKVDIQKARAVLDRDHYGLEKVKDRIIEALAVRQLVPELKGQILCLVGPPGVGKTSIAKSIAQCMGRKYVRVSLGGVRDESDIRGHRKTYIGAMPGRIINALRQAKSNNPLILLDEIDKMGNDFRGDPASAMLEVLDSEQNVAFRDHYIEVPFDISDAFFITTANTLDTIPAPLLDRMDVIHLYTYTREEKFHIAKEHLLQKQMKKHGLLSKTFKLNDDALYVLIDNYVRESGVRQLERMIAALCRKAAKKLVAKECKKVTVTAKNIEEFLGPKKYKVEPLLSRDEVGVATGLAWTSVGGETMPIEVSVVDGSGRLELTGSLGDVMKESAKAAITYIRSRAEKLHIDKDFYKNKDIHIHVPEGAIPKDGPSAGITMASALISALSNVPIKRDVAMTGEITLRGRVLAIGGLKEKTMAAYACGMKTVIIPQDNLPDLAEVTPVVKEHIRFVPAQNMDDVLHEVLAQVPPCEEPQKEPLMPPPAQAQGQTQALPI